MLAARGQLLAHGVALPRGENSSCTFVISRASTIRQSGPQTDLDVRQRFDDTMWSFMKDQGRRIGSRTRQAFEPLWRRAPAFGGRNPMKEKRSVFNL